MAKQKQPFVEPMPADKTKVYIEPPKAEQQKQQKKEEKKEEKEVIMEKYNKLKIGDEVTVASDLGSLLGRYDFHGKVVKVRDDAVMIEAPVTEEWRNFWKARLHRMQSAMPPSIYAVALANLTELDPIGFYDWANKKSAKYLGGWSSRVEIRKTMKGPVLRYILYKSDVEKGYIKELRIGKKEPEKLKEYIGEPIPAPGIAPEMVEKKEEVPIRAKPTPKPSVKLPDIELSPEIMAMGPRELLDLITLDYGLSGVYKGKNWIGGASGLWYGEQVAILQHLYNTLVEKGVVRGPKIKVDGKYGDDTRAAVERMQRAAGVTPDGFFGIDTKNGIYGLLGLAPKEEKGELPGTGEGGGAREEEERRGEEKEAVGQVLTLTREIEKDLKPEKGVTELMENFYVETDAGWLSAEKMVKRNLSEIDRTWETDKETAKKIAGKENWETKTLTRKNVGVFSWANTKKVLFPYLAASGQVFEFKTWEQLTREDGTVLVPAGKVIKGRISEYNEASGEFKVEVLAVKDEFTKVEEETSGAPAATPTEEAER
ncbi:MAG: peptidoglycan-binding domain-containing protein [Candidatus Anstonellales archaeon]